MDRQLLSIMLIVGGMIRNVFVGTLCALDPFLMGYVGYDKKGIAPPLPCLGEFYRAALGRARGRWRHDWSYVAVWRLI